MGGTTTTAFQGSLPRSQRLTLGVSLGSKVFRPIPSKPRRGDRLASLHAVSYPTQGSSADEDFGVAWESVLTSKPRPSPEHSDITSVDTAQILVATLGAAMAFYWLVTRSAPGAWRYFMAGGMCAAISHAIPTPVDVVQVTEIAFARLR